MPAKTEWFREAGWGVFTHYLADVASNVTEIELAVDDWNRRVDSFDVARLAAQLESVGAHYYCITLGQNSGFYCTPNAIYDALVGRTPSRCSARDLIADLSDELAPRGIRLMTYMPSHAPALDRMAIEGLRCTPEWDASASGINPGAYTVAEGTDERLTNFQRNWEAILSEWSRRWGDKVSGWWIDGCYFADRMYRNPDPPNFQSFAAAMKAGNPNSIVAFNPGVLTPIISVTEFEDYTAGEISNALPVRAKYGPNANLPQAAIAHGTQYHVLSYLGYGWGGQWEADGPRLSDDLVLAYTREVIRDGGVLTWDVPIHPDGAIPEPFLDQLRVLKSLHSSQ